MYSIYIFKNHSRLFTYRLIVYNSLISGLRQQLVSLVYDHHYCSGCSVIYKVLGIIKDMSYFSFLHGAHSTSGKRNNNLYNKTVWEIRDMVQNLGLSSDVWMRVCVIYPVWVSWLKSRTWDITWIRIPTGHNFKHNPFSPLLVSWMWSEVGKHILFDWNRKSYTEVRKSSGG